MNSKASMSDQIYMGVCAVTMLPSIVLEIRIRLTFVTRVSAGLVTSK